MNLVEALRARGVEVEYRCHAGQQTLSSWPDSMIMIVYFIGGSLGAAFGAVAVGWFGWPATAALAAAAIATAMAVTLTNRIVSCSAIR
ncbi:hypothetical protein [Nocardia sp. Marseille-Q1738]